ncbi:AAA family ATPase [Actinopolymorpha pittospori]|uniref:Glucokinase n=1 Tax=Actinopolymorpha pittospori TaxID=648752 RepID=A0A927RD90_9ACTN|nr:AAA family ATPase [Actinopolymorpha pittospori]MBE1610759.1 glucokinase [Actinopolymorpha pittospori]
MPTRTTATGGVSALDSTAVNDARTTILVNGLPAAGKSTLAPPLARTLGLPLLSKDIIKETHADLLGPLAPDGRSQRDWNRALGAAASETMWALLAHAPLGAVLESSWRSDVRPLVAEGLARAGVEHVAEVWCEVPAGVARARDHARHQGRHGIHGALMTDAEWTRMVETAEPLGLGPVCRVDTTAAVDVEALAAWCRAAANGTLPPYRQ